MVLRCVALYCIVLRNADVNALFLQKRGGALFRAENLGTMAFLQPLCASATEAGLLNGAVKRVS